MSVSYQFPLYKLMSAMQCGLTVQESDFRFQDDLTRMFAQNMQLSHDGGEQQMQENGKTLPTSYSISQHYHHSAHIALAEPRMESSGDTTSTSTPPTLADAKQLLHQHGVDPSCLLPSQLTLFEQALPDQKSRLVELWRISPPEYAGFGAQEWTDELGAWEQTTLEQEEAMARLRYARKNANNESRLDVDVMDDEKREIEQRSVRHAEENHMVEPYIDSGYEMLAQREYDQQPKSDNTARSTYSPLGSSVGNYNRALDPVYSGKGWWDFDQGEQPMEHQYGMFDQINQFGAPVPMTMGIHIPEDEEML